MGSVPEFRAGTARHACLSESCVWSCRLNPTVFQTAWLTLPFLQGLGKAAHLLLRRRAFGYGGLMR